MWATNTGRLYLVISSVYKTAASIDFKISYLLGSSESTHQSQTFDSNVLDVIASYVCITMPYWAASSNVTNVNEHVIFGHLQSAFFELYCLLFSFGFIIFSRTYARKQKGSIFPYSFSHFYLPMMFFVAALIYALLSLNFMTFL